MHCPECGFVNAEGANYCQKCGAFLGEPSRKKQGDTTEIYQVGETGELKPVDLEEVTARGRHAGDPLGRRPRRGDLHVEGERMTIGRSPDAEVFLDDVTVSRNHALLVRAPRRPLHRRPRLAQRHLREPAPDRVAQAPERRRAAGRQVQAHLPGASDEHRQARPSGRRPRAAGQKALTIGAVCKQLEREFPDISISKIRYLEDQKLLSPRRTQGGYRLYAPADVDRLRTILRLQRDEFLPLRVIRQELAAGPRRGGRRAPAEARAARPRGARRVARARPRLAVPARRRARGHRRRRALVQASSRSTA